ncbi:MAG TPA: DUF2189 domain-containing protein [Dongiaceae bacterium]|nr:DUF2189 domain-containing protein [Dongiaceae bacterium]
MVKQANTAKVDDVGEMPPEFAGLAVPVYRIDVEQPWNWLRLGWRDFNRARNTSLFFGAIIAIVSAALIYGMWQQDWLPYALPLTAGYMFMAPVLAVAFYEISRRLELGESMTLVDVALSWRRYPGQIFTMGLIMMLLHLIWERIALLIYALFYGTQPASWENFIQSIFFSTDGIPFLIVGALAGGVLAVVAFTISVVAFPMLQDRDCGTIRAIATSVLATKVNWRILMGWGALIVLFTFAGIASLCIGLAITMPLIGHASWHAYRDLVSRDDY